MKKLLLATILALGATQAMASSPSPTNPTSPLSPGQAAYKLRFSQCLEEGSSRSECYQKLRKPTSHGLLG